MNRSVFVGCRFILRGLCLAGFWFATPAARLAAQSPDGLDEWTRRSPVPTSAALSAIIHDGGQFLAGGQSGSLFSSADGLTWEERFSGTTQWIHGLSQAGARTVAVGEGGLILTSTDRVAWTRVAWPGTASLRAVAQGAGRWVAVGDQGTILTSEDGLDWRAQISGSTQRLFSIAYGHGRWIAVGDGGTILVSANAGFWSRAESNVIVPLFSVIAHTNGFTAGGDAGVIVTSADGSDWALQATPGLDAVFGLASVGEGTVSVGSRGAIWRAVERHTWRAAASPTSFPLRAVAAANGRSVAVGDGGTVVVSTDGTTWTKGTSGTQRPLFFTVFSNGRFLTGGANGALMRSEDGARWMENPAVDTNGLLAFARGAATEVLVGANGTILTSGDGVTWQRRFSGITQTLRGVAHGNGRFVAVADGGRILISTNTHDWLPTSTTSPTGLRAVAWGRTHFVAVGELGTILTSADGQLWTTSPSGVSETLSAITFGHGLFVAVGDAGTVCVSRDGLQWDRHSAGARVHLLGVTVGGGYFVCVGGGGAIFTSLDGREWTRRETRLSGSLFGVAFGGGRMVTAGDGGVIAQSAPVVAPPPILQIEALDAVAREPGEDTATLLITRLGSDADELVVRLAFDGTATPGMDFVRPPEFVIFPPGESSLTLVIRALDDVEKEEVETVQLALLSGAGYRLGERRTATLSIVDNDATLVSLAPTTLLLSEGAGTNAVLEVRRAGLTNAPLTVRLALSGTAEPGGDYVALTNVVVIPAGQTSTLLTIIPLDDTLREGPETVIVEVPVTSDYSVDVEGRATITIGDDDVNRVRLENDRDSISEPGLDRVTVTAIRAGSVQEELSVPVRTSGSATHGVDFMGTPARVVFSPGQDRVSFQLRAMDDNRVNEPREIILELVAGDDYALDSASRLTIEIHDNDKGLPPILRTLQVTDTGVSFRVIAPVGQQYRVEVADGSLDWRPLAILRQTEEVQRFEDAAPAARVRLYRARVLP